MKKIRFAIAQMNPTVGDYKGNAKKIIDWIKRAENKKADLIVFPELSLCGYPVWDLANKKSFVDEGLHRLSQICKSTARMDVTAVIGFVDYGGKPAGRNTNTMAWISKGRIIAKQVKRLLPTYDVFLEGIFFEPASKSAIIEWKGRRVGPTICEDLWDDRYEKKPLADLAAKRADLIVNISASPYYRGVAEVRDALLKRHASRYRFPILYVNQTGGQDDLIFDGRSLFADSNGRVLFRAPAFREDLFFFDWRDEKNAREIPPASHAGAPREVYDALVLGIRDYCRKNNFKKVVIGLSGGIDSALVAALAVDALGNKAVKGITMPGPYSSPGSWKDSGELASRLGIDFQSRTIQEKYLFMRRAYKKQKDLGHSKGRAEVSLALQNLQARLRGLELMFISNNEGRLLLSTGNKSELAMGYCTLYGDMAGGLCVIGDVYKTDVYRLSWYRNSLKRVIPDAILNKAPSAELCPGQKDEDSLPPYEILDEILYLYIEKNKSRDEIAASLRPQKISGRMISSVIRRVDHNEYKRRQTPPILRVTEKAWFGRRMPITNRFDS